MDAPAPTRDQIVEAARKAGQENGGALSRGEFMRRTGIGQYHIYRLFPEGGWTELRTLAGLAAAANANEAASDDDLLADYHRVASAVGRVPTWPVYASKSEYSSETLKKRFGGQDGTRRRYREWLAVHEPESPLLHDLEPRPSGVTEKVTIQRPPDPSNHAWAKAAGTEYGAPLDFRGLRHAPINEQGVVYLFGMISFELGFIVEAVHTSFPDCEAKRCVDRKNQRWQRVRIEFEYRSRNFLAHGHDLTGCDVIVCWEHDWPECPLEVVELKTIIGTLDKS